MIFIFKIMIISFENKINIHLKYAIINDIEKIYCILKFKYCLSITNLIYFFLKINKVNNIDFILYRPYKISIYLFFIPLNLFGFFFSKTIIKKNIKKIQSFFKLHDHNFINQYK